MTPAQRRALRWVLEQTIDISNENRPGMSPGDAQEEWDDLRELCGLLEPAERDFLLRMLGDAP